jgi:hypothetical protein
MSFLGKNSQRAKHVADDVGHFARGKIKRGAEFFDRVRDFRDAIVNPVRVVLRILITSLQSSLAEVVDFNIG